MVCLELRDASAAAPSCQEEQQKLASPGLNYDQVDGACVLRLCLNPVTLDIVTLGFIADMEDIM